MNKVILRLKSGREFTFECEREETIKWLKSLKAEIGKSEHRALWHYAEAIDLAIEALEGVCYDEWCTDCKEYDTEKKCCPRFNRVIRGAVADALDAIPSADRPRGHWEDMADFEQCSVCHGTHLKEVDTYYGKAIWIKTDFCPNCGADMRGEDK